MAVIKGLWPGHLTSIMDDEVIYYPYKSNRYPRKNTPPSRHLARDRDYVGSGPVNCFRSAPSILLGTGLLIETVIIQTLTIDV
jgi:hypothetical protein